MLVGQKQLCDAKNRKESIAEINVSVVKCCVLLVNVWLCCIDLLLSGCVR